MVLMRNGNHSVMKQIKIIIIVSLFILLGCSNNDLIENSKGQRENSFTTIQANVGEAADTRVSIINDNSSSDKTFEWNENDRILVFSDSQHYFNEYLMISYEGDKGEFGGDEISGNKFYALYPNWGWSSDKNNRNILHFDGMVYNFNSSANANNFKTNAPMIAISNDNNFSFKQTTGLIHVSLSNCYYIDYLFIIGNNNEKIGGPGYIDLSDNNPSFIVDESSNTGGINATIGQALSDGLLDVYFSLPPMTFEGGFSILIKGKDEKGNDFNIKKTTDKKVIIERAQVKNFKIIDLKEELLALEETTVKTKEILKKFYDSMGGDNWKNKTNWNSEAPLNEWYGLNVDYGILKGIYMWDNNLSGAIPSEFSELQLNSLTLGKCNITSLPNSLKEMQTLEVLSLNNCNLDTVPDFIRNLKNLHYLDLSNNHISNLPNWMSELKDNLRNLQLEYNMITCLPDCLSELTNLQTLDLFGNGLTTLPESLGNIEGLESLNLLGNRISGYLPEWISNLTNLRELCLGYNDFEGEIPASYFTNLTKLQNIDLEYNYLTGTITDEMQQSPMWKNLTNIYVMPQKNNTYIEIQGAVKNINLNTTTLTLHIGEEYELKVVSVLPTDAYNTSTYWDLTWPTNGIISLNEDGKIKALKEGQTQVWCRASDNNGTRVSCTITVIPAE